MKLYDIPEKSKIYEECSDKSKFFIFHHIDGMYSYCLTEKGGVINVGATTDLEEHKDGYKLK